METDVFLCYRRAGAQTAKLLHRYLESIHFPAKVWYSDGEIVGNYKHDIPGLVGSAKCAVLFVDEHFTSNFTQLDLEFECITALEIVEIEKQIQANPEFRLLIVTLDCQGFSKSAQNDLRILFERAGIYQEQSIDHFAQSNTIHFQTAKDDEYLLFDRLAKELLSDSLVKTHPVQGNFNFGNRPTMADIVVWDADNGIACSDISFELTLDQIPLHRKIDKIRCPESSEIQNNQVVSLTGLEVSLSDNDERKQVIVYYQPIEYKLFHKTLRIWNTAGLNLNQKLTCFTLESGQYEIPNAMGLAFMVVTSDHKLIFTKRSSKRAIRPNEYDCSIVEGLKLEAVSRTEGVYDIFDWRYVDFEIRRAFREEISPNDQNLTIKINGIVLDKEYGQWNIVGSVFTPETAEDLIRKHAVRNDTYEYIHMEPVPLYNADGQRSLSALKAMLPKFFRHKMWSMALAVLYGTLRNLDFAESDIDQICS